ncbi:hypothetical protein SLEP1_g18416 [Rubroshorea leprosula]|uniref:Leucine-rich repeat-containing N-terminal plant-type domain-containing protein n=1 Tax=Rubroshorea leprosula TaxID=152421 RepID=A0AAV5IXB6_9ROSI|nr:hypothetical protein SLEP1_g18416 [Rubroshorea leprosula]
MCQGCLEQERIALLQLKQFFNDPWGLRNWGRGKENSDCCQWEMVRCNPFSGRVIELHLDHITRSGAYNYLNASLFLPFEELKNLYLGGNGIVGCIENEDFHRLSKLSNFEFLDLSWNDFNSNMLLSLSELSSLKSLNLAGNYLQVSNHTNGFERLSKLRSLEILDLSYNYLNNSILKSLNDLLSLKSLYLVNCNLIMASNHTKAADLENLSRLNHLEFLDLSSNMDLNNILSYLSSLSSLKTLILWNCGLKGTLSAKGFMRFSNLRNLKILDLSGNDLNINILTSLSELPSLKSLRLAYCNLLIASNHRNGADFEKLSRLHHLEFLDLSDNTDLNNNILSYLSSFSSLKTLILSNCRLNGTLSTKELGNLRNLKVLDISFNNIESLKSSQDDQNLRFVHLEVLDMSNNFFNNNVLSFVSEFSNIKSLNIEENNLKGLVDVTKFDALRSLEKLFMSYNKLDQFVSTNANTSFSKLKTLYLNKIFPEESSVPAQLSLKAFPSLKKLYLKENYHLNQTLVIQTSQVLSNLEELFLDQSPLSINFLQNIGALASLRSISLKNCGVIGTLPTQDRNNFEGEILNVYFSRSSYLNILDISNNNLSGELPRWIKNLTYLQELDLSSNHFEGSIPEEFCYNAELELLDLSHNNLSGSWRKQPFWKHSTMDQLPF